MKTSIKSCLAVMILSSASSQAAFHLFDIQEAYSNADGSVQFIELFSSSGGQQFLSTHAIAFFTGVAQTSTFTFPTNLPSDSLNKSVLIGTVNLTALYSVTPDYIIPANFFAAGASNTLNFGLNQDTVSISTLPNDGVRSLNAIIGNGNTPGTTSINTFATPTNFAGQTAVIPEPSAVVLYLVASTALVIRRKRIR